MNNPCYVVPALMGRLGPMVRWLRSHGAGERTLKTVLACVLAWEIGSVIPGGTAHPYFAPLAALLSLQITVAESISGALQRVAGIVAGVAVALVVSHLAGETAWGIGLLILLALVVGANLRLSAQGVSQVAISALLVSVAGGAGSLSYAGSRIVESIVGAVIGVAVNALIVPPSRLPDARVAHRSLGLAVAAVLNDLAVELRGGLTRERALKCLQEARALEAPRVAANIALQSAATSLRYNVRSRAQQRHLARYQQGVDILEHAVIQVRVLARMLADAVGDGGLPAGGPGWTTPNALATAVAGLLAALAAEVAAVTDYFDDEGGSVVAVERAIAATARQRHDVSIVAEKLASEAAPEMWMHLGALLAVADRMRADLATSTVPSAEEREGAAFVDWSR